MITDTNVPGERKMNFKEAYELQIGGHVEKKGKFSYLSWVFAVRYLRENFPEAQWIIHENAEGQPLFKMPKGYMVKVSVVEDGQPYTQWHPILNYQNKPIEEPDCFQVNTSIQRCLTKAIGLATGIGLGLYAGEDLPQEEEKKIDHVDNWEKEADKHADSLDMLSTWYLSSKPEILKLNAADQKSVNSYVKQLKDVLEEEI